VPVVFREKRELLNSRVTFLLKKQQKYSKFVTKVDMENRDTGGR
jgi:hypothetical protein